MSAVQSEAAAGEEVNAPVVFQCAGCKQIVTDSNFMVDFEQSSQRLTFSALCGVRGRRGAPDRADEWDVACSSCGAVLGRARPGSGPDAVLFDLNSPSLQSYMLGSCVVGAKMDMEGEPSAAAAGSTSKVYETTVESLALEMGAMKEAIVLMDARTAALEQALKELTADAGDSRESKRVRRSTQHNK